MIAAATGIAVEQDANLLIVGFIQALDINARTFFFGHDGVVGEGFAENMTIIIRTADIVEVNRIFFDQNQQCVTKTIGAKWKPSAVVVCINMERHSRIFDAMLMNAMAEIPEPRCHQSNHCEQKH